MAENQLAVAAQNKKQQIKAFNDIVNNAYYQNQLKSLFGKNAGTFATSMMELYTSNADLQQCDPKLVAAEAMKAAALHLPIQKSLGRAHVVVFKNKGIPTPTFIPGWKGLVDLAVRTGQYLTVNPTVVYEGELRGVDKLSGFIDISGEKESNKVLGYVGYFELIGGFKKMVYMTLKDMCHFAKTKAPSLKYNQKVTEQTLYELAQKQAEEGPAADGMGWLANFESMAKKTVIRRVLDYGPMSIEMQTAISLHDQAENAEAIRDAENLEARPVINASQMMQDAEEVKAEEVKEEPEDKPDF